MPVPPGIDRSWGKRQQYGGYVCLALSTFLPKMFLASKLFKAYHSFSQRHNVMWFLIEDKKGDFLPGMDKDVGNT